MGACSAACPSAHVSFGCTNPGVGRQNAAARRPARTSERTLRKAALGSHAVRRKSCTSKQEMQTRAYCGRIILVIGAVSNALPQVYPPFPGPQEIPPCTLLAMAIVYLFFSWQADADRAAHARQISASASSAAPAPQSNPQRPAGRRAASRGASAPAATGVDRALSADVDREFYSASASASVATAEVDRESHRRGAANPVADLADAAVPVWTVPDSAQRCAPVMGTPGFAQSAPPPATCQRCRSRRHARNPRNPRTLGFVRFSRFVSTLSAHERFRSPHRRSGPVRSRGRVPREARAHVGVAPEP